MNRSLQTVIHLIILLGCCGSADAEWREEIGYSRLQLLLGSGFFTVPVQGFAQAEASLSAETAIFEPNTASPNYAGKTFDHLSGTSQISSHADEVATYFYGNTTSLVTGDCPVDLYFADDWVETALLKRGSGSMPGVQSRAVENHSWIGTDLPESEVQEIDRRLDFAIDRDGFVCVLGVNNGNSTTLPSILCQSYHTLSVGLANGNHSAGFTYNDGAGRIKPDIVAPADYTSFATPMVASAAGLLYAKLAAPPYSLTGADLPRVIKSLLLASATKDTVAGWSNSPSVPLDLRYGAGELNIHHACGTLLAGRMTASTSTESSSRGWSAESVPPSGSKTYFFNIPAGPAPPFSATLTWHRQVTGHRTGPTVNWTSSLADLNLRLHQASGFTVGAAVSESLSLVDNVELISSPALPPGQYALVIENLSTADTPYALAWHSLPAVTIAAPVPHAKEVSGEAAQMTITRSGDTAIPLYVPLVTSGNAVAGTDFTPLPPSVTIPAGQSTVTLQISPLPDDLAEGNRNLTVGIGTDFALVRDATSAAIITIEDKPFDAWRFAHFTMEQLSDPAVSSATADPDADQLANLVEYAVASDPLESGISPVVAGETGGFLTLGADKSETATDIGWSAEVSGDLGTWEPAVIVENTPTHFQARDPIQRTAADKRFIRLKISRP